MKKLCLLFSFLASVMSIMAAENLALNQKISASHHEEDAPNCVSPDPERQKKAWNATLQPNETKWIQVDFGKPISFGCVVLRWHHAVPPAYRIEVSVDGETYHEVAQARGDLLQTQGFGFPTETARSVRLTLWNSTEKGKSAYLKGFEVYEQ